MKKNLLNIIYEDKEILAVYKEKNLLTIMTKDKKTFNNNLYHFVYEYLLKKKERPFIVHRLDYETSGIVLFAKNYQMKEKLQSAFEKREVLREYEAVIKEKINLDYKNTIVQYLVQNPNSFKVYETKDIKAGKLAITHIEACNYINIGTALKIRIETGRKNQIRLALKKAGFTLIGDERYAFDKAKRMYLNEYHLSFKKGLLKVDDFRVEPLWIKKTLD